MQSCGTFYDLFLKEKFLKILIALMCVFLSNRLVADDNSYAGCAESVAEAADVSPSTLEMPSKNAFDGGRIISGTELIEHLSRVYLAGGTSFEEALHKMVEIEFAKLKHFRPYFRDKDVGDYYGDIYIAIAESNSFKLIEEEDFQSLKSHREDSPLLGRCFNYLRTSIRNRILADVRRKNRALSLNGMSEGEGFDVADPNAPSPQAMHEQDPTLEDPEAVWEVPSETEQTLGGDSIDDVIAIPELNYTPPANQLVGEPIDSEFARTPKFKRTAAKFFEDNPKRRQIIMESFRRQAKFYKVKIKGEATFRPIKDEEFFAHLGGRYTWGDIGSTVFEKALEWEERFSHLRGTRKHVLIETAVSILLEDYYQEELGKAYAYSEGSAHDNSRWNADWSVPARDMPMGYLAHRARVASLPPAIRRQAFFLWKMAGATDLNLAFFRKFHNSKDPLFGIKATETKKVTKQAIYSRLYISSSEFLYYAELASRYPSRVTALRGSTNNDVSKVLIADQQYSLFILAIEQFLDKFKKEQPNFNKEAFLKEHSRADIIQDFWFELKAWMVIYTSSEPDRKPTFSELKSMVENIIRYRFYCLENNLEGDLVPDYETTLASQMMRVEHPSPIKAELHNLYQGFHNSGFPRLSLSHGAFPKGSGYSDLLVTSANDEFVPYYDIAIHYPTALSVRLNSENLVLKGHQWAQLVLDIERRLIQCAKRLEIAPENLSRESFLVYLREKIRIFSHSTERRPSISEIEAMIVEFLPSWMRQSQQPAPAPPVYLDAYPKVIAVHIEKNGETLASADYSLRRRLLLLAGIEEILETESSLAQIDTASVNRDEVYQLFRQTLKEELKVRHALGRTNQPTVEESVRPMEKAIPAFLFRAKLLKHCESESFLATLREKLSSQCPDDFSELDTDWAESTSTERFIAETTAEWNHSAELESYDLPTAKEQELRLDDIVERVVSEHQQTKNYPKRFSVSLGVAKKSVSINPKKWHQIVLDTEKHILIQSATLGLDAKDYPRKELVNRLRAAVKKWALARISEDRLPTFEEASTLMINEVDGWLEECDQKQSHKPPTAIARARYPRYFSLRLPGKTSDLVVTNVRWERIISATEREITKLAKNAKLKQSDLDRSSLLAMYRPLLIEVLMSRPEADRYRQPPVEDSISLMHSILPQWIEQMKSEKKTLMREAG